MDNNIDFWQYCLTFGKLRGRCRVYDAPLYAGGDVSNIDLLREFRLPGRKKGFVHDLREKIFHGVAGREGTAVIFAD